MFSFRKRLFYLVKVERRDPVLAEALMEHYAGRNSEFSAVAQYLNHRSNIHNRQVSELLGLIASEELGHMEMIGVAISKLGGPQTTYTDAQGKAWSTDYIDQSFNPVEMLQADAEAELKAKMQYDELLTRTNDPGLKRLLGFIGKREEVHHRLFSKAAKLLNQEADTEKLIQLIYDYKMSLQVLE